MEHEELPEERHLENLALGNPPEIERDAVKRRDVDYRVVVQHDDIALAPVGVLAADDPLPPERRDEKEDADQHARKFVDRAARLVERPAYDQRDGRQKHEDRAQSHQKQII